MLRSDHLYATCACQSSACKNLHYSDHDTEASQKLYIHRPVSQSAPRDSQSAPPARQSGRPAGPSVRTLHQPVSLSAPRTRQTERSAGPSVRAPHRPVSLSTPRDSKYRFVLRQNLGTSVRYKKRQSSTRSRSRYKFLSSKLKSRASNAIC